MMARGERKAAREYLLAHPDANNAEVMEAISCSMRTVSNARADLRGQGLGKQAYGDRRYHVNPITAVEKATEGAFDVQTTADLNKAVASELERDAAANAAADAELGPDGDVDISKLKRMLWRVVHRNADDRIVVAAASALARIQQEADSRPLGPGKPLTKRDAKDRFLMMCRAVGVEFVIECINEWTGNATKTVDTSIAAPASPPDSGATNNQAPVRTD